MSPKSLIQKFTQTPDGWSTESPERMSYYTYFAGQNIIYTLFNTCLTTYLLFLGVDPIKSATVMLAVKIWDAVNDTIFGVIFDSVKFKSGRKYLPWIRISTFLIPMATVLTFIIPKGTSETVKLVWFAVAYMLWDTAYTLCDVPIFGIITSMSRNLDERNTILSYKSIWTYIGVGITSTLSTVLVSEKVGMSYGLISIILCVMAFILMTPASFKLKERFSSEGEESFTIKRMFIYLFRNKYLLIYYVGLFFSLSLNIGNAFNLFVSYYLFHSTLFSLVVGAVGTFPQLAASLLLPRIIRKVDKMKLYRFCTLLTVVLGLLIWTIGYKNIWLYIILFTIRSMPLAITGLQMFMFTPDCAEYGRYKTGIDAKGITFSIQTFIAKLSGSISGALGLFLLGLKSVGWQNVEVSSFEELERLGVQQTPHALNMLWMIFMLVPTIGYAIGYIIWRFYKLKDVDVQVMADCNAGKITKEEAQSQLTVQYK